MKKLNLIFAAFGLLLNFSTSAQVNFKADFKKANPVDAKSSISNEEKINIHTRYLNNAFSTKNSTQQFYGCLFLYVDYYKAANYVEANKYLLKADSIAIASKKKSWQSAVFMRKAALSDVLHQDENITIDYYKKAIELCIATNDSLCIGESLEQLGSLYGFLAKYDSAHYYYKLALPVLLKFADRTQMAVTYNNYSILLSQEKRFAESISYADSAISIANAANDTYKEMMYRNNLGSNYSEMGNHDKAIEIYNYCMAINKKNNWADRLTKNYIGLFEAYEAKGDYRSAFRYLKSFYLFKDSLTGLEVQSQIATLNTKFETQQKELALEKSQLVLSETKRDLEKRNFLIVLILILTGAGIYFWRTQLKRNRKELNENRSNLLSLTQRLIEKNTQLAELEEQLASRSPFRETSADANGFDTNLYNQRILTDGDWSAFKIHFEKAYPSYLLRLRNKYPSLTEAEERLFLFIKLNLKSKEIAAILGISVDSVKKTRTRLRKRLDLAEEVDLDEFVLGF